MTTALIEHGNALSHENILDLHLTRRVTTTLVVTW